MDASSRFDNGATTASPLLLCLFSFLLFTAPITVVSAKSRRAITDAEIVTNKNACYADIESGLWGWECKSSNVAKENCALRCLSPQCYELIYESDPLEEGEKDFARGQEYKFCMISYVVAGIGRVPHVDFLVGVNAFDGRFYLKPDGREEALPAKEYYECSRLQRRLEKLTLHEHDRRN
ncbi:hypothetical protein Dimus_024128 [Dionaea muscipula]